MPFLYIVCNVKLQLCAKELASSKGESTSKYVFYFEDWQKQKFQPIFSNQYLSKSFFRGGLTLTMFFFIILLLLLLVVLLVDEGGERIQKPP